MFIENIVRKITNREAYCAIFMFHNGRLGNVYVRMLTTRRKVISEFSKKGG